VSQSEEETKDWHALPGMIGDIINAETGTFVVCGGYIVAKNDDQDVVIYDQLDIAGVEDDLDQHGDATFVLDDAVYSALKLANIPAPDDGWDSETHELPADIWGGYE